MVFGRLDPGQGVGSLRDAPDAQGTLQDWGEWKAAWNSGRSSSFVVCPGSNPTLTHASRWTSYSASLRCSFFSSENTVPDSCAHVFTSRLGGTRRLKVQLCFILRREWGSKRGTGTSFPVGGELSHRGSMCWAWLRCPCELIGCTQRDLMPFVNADEVASAQCADCPHTAPRGAQCSSTPCVLVES